MKYRLDQLIVRLGLVQTRSQAESWIRLGSVTVDGRVVRKTGTLVEETQVVRLNAPEQYVSRAGLKLSSISVNFSLDFRDKLVLDVGSSTGGFTDYALKHGARRVVAVDVGTEQMHPSLRGDARVELHEKTDIREFKMSETPDIVVIDVSFISLRQVLPAIQKLCGAGSRVVAMMKPQFEARRDQLTRGGIVKNDTVRRGILREFEEYLRSDWRIITKADSGVRGAKGNLERFYLIRL